MFAYLKGKVCDVTEDNLVLENGGIGFNIKIPASLPSMLPGIGREVKIYTHTCVREDAFCLYGFLTRDDLEMFRLLITVNGIGPKGGLAVLSVLSADEVRMAVLTQDAKTLSRAPGIGTRTAQRILLDLKDKVSLEDSLMPREETVQAQPDGARTARTEAVEALTALGYSSSEALRAVRSVENADSMDVEELLKAALKNLF